MLFVPFRATRWLGFTSSTVYGPKYFLAPLIPGNRLAFLMLCTITSPTDPGMNSHMLTEFETSDEELPVSNDPYEVPKNEYEWIESITSTRKNNKMTAIQNIKKNQKVQKITYDRKVKRNR